MSNSRNINKAYKDVKYYLEELLNKKGPKREDALVSIVEVLRNSTFKFELGFLNNNFATFLYRCLSLFKKGSAKELQLSSQAIGLLAVIIIDKDDSNEIYRDVVPVISKALKSGTPKTLKVFECLATATFFGASLPAETQTAMQSIWTFLCPESDSSAEASNYSSDVLVAAISAWLFLLSSLERWSVSSKYWRGAISYFLNLLENDDQPVRVIAGTALALILEIGSLKKFVSREDISISSDSYSSLEETITNEISEKLERFCLKQESNDAANKAYKDYSQVLDYLKNDCCPKLSRSVGKDSLSLSSWSKIIQLNYLKSFMGDHGLDAHMLENPKLQGIFDFTKTKTVVVRKELYKPTFEKATVSFCVPKEKDISALSKKDIKKDRVMRSSILDKAKTKLRNQNRKTAEERKHTFMFDY